MISFRFVFFFLCRIFAENFFFPRTAIAHFTVSFGSRLFCFDSTSTLKCKFYAAKSKSVFMDDFMLRQLICFALRLDCMQIVYMGK